MRIEWSEGAYADYDEILGYLISEFGQQTASEFQLRLNYNVSVLAEFPLIGQSEYTNHMTLIEYRSLSCCGQLEQPVVESRNFCGSK